MKTNKSETRVWTSASRAAVLLAATAGLLLADRVNAETIYGVTTTQLVKFDTTGGVIPTGITAPVVLGTLSGLVSGHTIRGIDFRPKTGELFAVSRDEAVISNYQIYTVNLTTAALSPVGSIISVTDAASSTVSIDFNPVTDQIRLVNGTTQNVRISPTTGAVISVDPNLTFAPGDVNEVLNSPDGGLSDITVGDIAYTNNVRGASATTLYGYDYETDNLVRIGSVGGKPLSADSGQSFTLGGPGASAQTQNLPNIGLDISGETGVAYFLRRPVPSTNPFQVYSVNLANGVLTTLGTTTVIIRDIAVAIPGPLIRTKGDFNFNAAVADNDVAGFAAALEGDFASLVSANPSRAVSDFVIAGDFDGDGAVGDSDIAGFVASVLAGSGRGELVTLAVVRNGQGGNVPTFGGAPVTASDVLTKFTYLGDANLDGVVNDLDYANIIKGIRASGTLKGWYWGDFNYDGVVNGLDLSSFYTAFNFQGAPFTGFEEVVVGGGAGVIPEPSTLGLLAVPGMLLARRRRA